MSGGSRFDAVLFDWGGTLMVEEGGPPDVPIAQWPEVAAIDGARATLAALAPFVRLCVATNATVSTRPMIELALRRVGLIEYISDVFCFTEIGVRKESARFWTHVCAKLGVQPERVLMVGDDWEQDVMGARRAGVTSVWFDVAGRRAPADEAVRVVRKLESVVPWVLDDGGDARDAGRR